MRVLLVQPPTPPTAIAGDDWFVFEPLALEYLAAGIVHDAEVRILDLRFDRDLRSALEAFEPELVGITAYTVHVNTVRHLFETVKQWDPHTLTVVGGHHATVAPEDFRSSSIDLTVVGEGVHPFREIVRRTKSHTGFDGIPGVAGSSPAGPVRDDGEAVRQSLLGACRLAVYRLSALPPDASSPRQQKPRTPGTVQKLCASCRVIRLRYGRRSEASV